MNDWIEKGKNEENSHVSQNSPKVYWFSSWFLIHRILLGSRRFAIGEEDVCNKTNEVSKYASRKLEMFYLNTIEQLFLFIEQLDQLEVYLIVNF